MEGKREAQPTALPPGAWRVSLLPSRFTAWDPKPLMPKGRGRGVLAKRPAFRAEPHKRLRTYPHTHPGTYTHTHPASRKPARASSQEPKALLGAWLVGVLIEDVAAPDSSRTTTAQSLHHHPPQCAASLSLSPTPSLLLLSKWLSAQTLELLQLLAALPSSSLKWA